MEVAIKMEEENKLDIKYSQKHENYLDQLTNTSFADNERRQNSSWASNMKTQQNNDNAPSASTASGNRSLQQADLPQMHGYNKIKRHAVTNNQQLASTRCGEIFVSNNAKKWTFVCTFCNKSTRDIGAFILHLKKMHLTGLCDDIGSDDALSSCGGDQLEERACNISGQEQDVSY